MSVNCYYLISVSEKIIVGPHGVPDPPSLAQMTFTQCTHKGLGLPQVEKKVLKKELKKITALKKYSKKEMHSLSTQKSPHKINTKDLV